MVLFFLKLYCSDYINTVFFQVLSPANTISSTSCQFPLQLLTALEAASYLILSVMQYYIYVCVSLPSSKHFARVDLFYFW